MEITKETIEWAIGGLYFAICLLAMVSPEPKSEPWKTLWAIVRRLSIAAPPRAGWVSLPGRDPLAAPKRPPTAPPPAAGVLALVLAATAATGCGEARGGRVATTIHTHARALADTTVTVTALGLDITAMLTDDPQRAGRLAAARDALLSGREGVRVIFEVSSDPDRFRECEMMSHVDEASDLVAAIIRALVAAGVEVPPALARALSEATLMGSWYATECEGRP